MTRRPRAATAVAALVLLAGWGLAACGGAGGGDDLGAGAAGTPSPPASGSPAATEPDRTSTTTRARPTALPPAPATEPTGGEQPAATTAPPVADPWDVEPVAPPYQPTPVVLDGPDPVRVAVPAIGVDVALVDLGIEADGSMQVPADPDDAGWYTGGARRGETGAAVVAGHVDSHTGPAVFFRLRELVPGDEVVVTRADGSRAVFTVGSVEEFANDAFPTDRVFGAVTDSELRVVTCGGGFDRVARSYRANVVAFASLTRVEPA